MEGWKSSWLMTRASKEKLLGSIETVVGVCPHCNEKALLLSIVEDIFKCTLCDQDVQQYVNGHIKYIVMDDEKKNLNKAEKRQKKKYKVQRPRLNEILTNSVYLLCYEWRMLYQQRLS